jgi:hypothetical protein
MTKIRAEQISSGSATVGQVATADGSGNTTWEDPTGGSGPSTGKYRQFTYVVSGGDFSFIIDPDGNPVMALQELE